MRRICRTGIAGVLAMGLGGGLLAQPASAPAGRQAMVRQTVVPVSTTAPDGYPRASVINLEMKQAHPREIYAEVARQAGAQLRTYPKDLWDSRQWEKMDLSLKNATLWGALRELEAMTGLGLQRPGPDRELVIAQSSGPLWGELPGSECGAFYVLAQSMHRHHTADLTTGEVKRTCTIRLTLYGEPKLRILRGPMITKIEQAVDENGKPIPTQDPASERQPITGSWSWSVSAILTPPGDVGKRIARLKGYTKLVVQTRSEIVEIPEVLHAANTTRQVAGRTLRIREVRRNSSETYTVTATLTREAEADESVPWDEINFLHTFRMVDGEGNALSRRNYGGTSAGPSNTLELSMVFARDEWNGEVGEPAKLIWEVPLGSRELNVPFEFVDLTLP